MGVRRGRESKKGREEREESSKQTKRVVVDQEAKREPARSQ